MFGAGRERNRYYRSGGTRGGQDQFQWKDVKEDKDRENYLGHSQMAAQGRWQRGKDILWYTRGEGGKEVQGATNYARLNAKANSQSHAAEIRARELQRERDREEDIMNQALGLAPRKRFYGQETTMDDSEMLKMVQRGDVDRAITDIERVEGLGAAPIKTHDHIKRKTLAEKYVDGMKREEELSKVKFMNDTTSPRSGGGGGGMSKKEMKKAKKQEKKEKKKEKKERKKEKKRGKKERKRASEGVGESASKRARHGSDSDSD